MSSPPSSPDPLALTAASRPISRKRKREADSPSPTTERRPKVDQARRSPKHVRFAAEGTENDPDPDEFVIVKGDESKVLREVMRGRARPAVARGRGGGRGGRGGLKRSVSSSRPTKAVAGARLRTEAKGTGGRSASSGEVGEVEDELRLGPTADMRPVSKDEEPSPQRPASGPALADDQRESRTELVVRSEPGSLAHGTKMISTTDARAQLDLVLTSHQLTPTSSQLHLQAAISSLLATHDAELAAQAAQLHDAHRLNEANLDYQAKLQATNHQLTADKARLASDATIAATEAQRAAERYEAQIGELSARVDEVERGEELLRREMGVSSSARDTLAQKLDASESVQTTLETRNVDLAAQVEELGRAKQSIDEEAGRLQIQLVAADRAKADLLAADAAKLTNAQASLDILRSDLSKLTDANAHLLTDNTNLKHVSAVANESAKTWEVSWAELGRTNTDLVRQLGELGQTHASLELERTDLAAQFAASTQAHTDLDAATGRALGRADEETLAIEARVNELVGLAQRLEHALDAFRGEQTRLEEMVVNLEGERTALDAAASDAEREARWWKDTSSQLETDNDLLKSNVGSLEIEKISLQRINAELITSADQAQSDAEASDARWKDTVANLEQQIDSLVSHVIQSDERVDDLQRQRDSLVRQRTGLTRDLAAEGQARAKLVTRIKQGREREQGLKDEVACLVSERSGLVRRCEVAEKEGQKERRKTAMLERYVKERREESRKWESEMLGLLEACDKELESELGEEESSLNSSAHPVSTTQLLPSVVLISDTPFRPCHATAPTSHLPTPETTPVALPFRPLPTSPFASPDTPTHPPRLTHPHSDTPTQADHHRPESIVPRRLGGMKRPAMEVAMQRPVPKRLKRDDDGWVKVSLTLVDEDKQVEEKGDVWTCVGAPLDPCGGGMGLVSFRSIES